MTEIIVKVKDLPMEKPEYFKPFQGELKNISKKDLQKLKFNMLKDGFTSPIYIWKNVYCS